VTRTISFALRVNGVLEDARKEERPVREGVVHCGVGIVASTGEGNVVCGVHDGVARAPLKDDVHDGDKPGCVELSESPHERDLERDDLVADSYLAVFDRRVFAIAHLEGRGGEVAAPEGGGIGASPKAESFLSLLTGTARLNQVWEA